MPDQRAVDITELAVLGEQFPMRLMQLGFHLMQVIDEAGHDQYRYVVPPVCDVPEGTFMMGSDEQLDEMAIYDEIPQDDIFVPAFQIGVYPVTVAEYACAVKAGIVEEPQANGMITWQAQQQCLDYPVVCVNWHEVTLYAAWLSRVTGSIWRLPTEAEWEKAARGTDGRIYPWGNTWDNTRANTTESGLEAMTPVGYYADRQDASPYGAHDMAGNILEWTSSIYQEHPPYRADQAENNADITSARVLRGGSWDEDPLESRMAYRDSLDPSDTYGEVGVRLVREL
jgi:formylglycine-generating enzyme required for sulfatase activity